MVGTLSQLATIKTTVLAGDLNHDGRLDLVANPGADRTIVVLLGNGNGTFQPPTSYTVAKHTANMFLLADLNNNGNLDVLLTSAAAMLGHGDGTLAAPLVSPGAFGFNGTLTDIKGDGKLDLITPFGNGVAVQQGQGDGTFLPSNGQYPAGLFPAMVLAADFNLDGKMDLVALNY